MADRELRRMHRAELIEIIYALKQSEDQLKAQFEGVVRSFVPMHSIVRIDEVERLGTPKISEARGVSNVMPFPFPMPEK